MVNELPYNVRTKELILASLWFGKDKPDINIFRTLFVENINELATKRVQCNINGAERLIQIFSRVFCVNAMARAPVQESSQYSASHGPYR